MVFPYTSWPTSVDPIVDRTDGSDVIFAADLEYQDDQIRTIQTWLGYAGRFIGGDIAGAGATGIVSPEATGGVAFTIAARQNFTSGTLLSVGDNYNGVYTEVFSIEYNGQAYVDGNRVLTEDAAEFASITEKATPVSADLLLIEDSEDANSKKRVQVGNLPGGGASDGRGFAIVIGNSLAGDTSDICDYLDVGDCVQLKAGIEAAAGKPVYIRPGTYDWNNGSATSNQITVPAGTRVLGAGMDAVTIRLLDSGTEGEAFVLQGSGSVLQEFEIVVPTPVALIDSSSSQGYIYNTTGTGSTGLIRVRVEFEDSGWSTLSGDYSAMRYVIYSDSNGDRFFIQDCEILNVPNYDSTPALHQARIQIMACYGQLDTIEVRGTFSWGGYAAYELGADQVVFSDNIIGSIAYDYALRLIGNGFSPGTERPARIVNNDIGMLYDPAESSQYGILCLTNIGLVVAANNITLEGGTHANTIAIDIGSSDRATIVANRFDAESGWQYAVDCGSSSTGTIVANHFGAATITGSTSGWSIGLNYPVTAITDADAIHDNVNGEINAITEKTTPVGADLIVIEDSAASYAKKKVQITNLPGGSGTDADAIHDNVAAEISAITAKATPTTSDYLIIEDAAAGDAKKSITIGDLPAAAPATHVSTHEPGGGDALTVDAVAGTGSLRTLGTGAQQACAGNDSRLSDARTPTSHATTHEPGGGDAMTVDAAAATGSLRTLGTGAAQACAGNDSRLSDARTPTAHNTTHQSGGGDAIKLDDLAAPDDNTDLDATVSAHGLLPKLGGGSTNFLRADGTWAAPAGGSGDATSLQGTDIDAGLAPTDGQVLTYDGTGAQWIAASPAEGTSYLEMGQNHTITSAGGSPDSEDVGRAIFDASQHNSITFRAILNSAYATTGSSSVKLYDDGSLTTPGTPRLVTTFTQTDDTLTYEVFEQALTVVASGAGTNEILGEPRVYRAVVEITATSSDTTTVSTVGFAAVGNGDVVTLSADMVQAIAMSLNA